MQNTDPFNRIEQLYHFTDTRNLALIRHHQGILSLATLRDREVIIPAPGGNDWSHQADKREGLDRYVHLCFRNQHPMEYLAKQDGRIANSIFLEISSRILSFPGVLFTADVSNKSGVARHALENARDLIDFEVLYNHTNWSDHTIQARLKNCTKYEILVPNIVPLEMIRNLPDG